MVGGDLAELCIPMPRRQALHVVATRRPQGSQTSSSVGWGDGRSGNPATSFCRGRRRHEGDGYLTIDAPWVVPALLRSVLIEGRVLEPAAGRGHLSLELRRAGFEVMSFDSRRYENPLVPDIEQGDIRRLTTLAGFAWVVTNLPYEHLEELATHLIDLGARSQCAVALLVRAEWIVAKARRALVHEHPRFAGTVMLTARPRWVPKTPDSEVAASQFLLVCMESDAARWRFLAQVRRAGGECVQDLRPSRLG